MKKAKESPTLSPRSVSPLKRFGDLLIELGLVTERQVREAMTLQPQSSSRLGESLLSLGYLTRPQLQRALAQALRSGDALVLDRPPLGEVLYGLKYVTADGLEAAIERQRVDERRLGELLVELGECTPQQVNEALRLQARMGPQPSYPPPLTPLPSTGKRLLIVDDSPLVLNLLSDELTSRGYQTITTNDAVFALEEVARIKPDLVVTALNMPGLDGLDFARRLKASPATRPIIILTSSDAETQRVRGLKAGADDYLAKSASLDELGARIETVLRRADETEHLRRLFARYTSDAVVDELLRTSANVSLTGEKRIVTVLFADLRGFTGLAETMPPEDVLALLNDVLGRLADVVLEWGGTLDKFLGDGLMAIWGAPVHRDDDTLAAVGAALAMHDAIRERNALPSSTLALELGIGLNTGVAVVGSLGNARRSEYTCIGDVVNVASRLCAMAGPQELLTGQGTAERLAAMGGLERLPDARIKGKAQAVPIFKVPPTFGATLGGLRRPGPMLTTIRPSQG